MPGKKTRDLSSRILQHYTSVNENPSGSRRCHVRVKEKGLWFGLTTLWLLYLCFHITPDYIWEPFPQQPHPKARRSVSYPFLSLCGRTKELLIDFCRRHTGQACILYPFLHIPQGSGGASAFLKNACEFVHTAEGTNARGVTSTV